MEQLEPMLGEFSQTLSAFRMPEPVMRTVRELRADTNWPWGYASGVYLFVQHGNVQYVGRALGATLGARLWSHINEHDNQQWAALNGDDDVQVLTYTLEPEQVFIAAALEAFLIERLRPPLNKRVG